MSMLIVQLEQRKSDIFGCLESRDVAKNSVNLKWVGDPFHCSQHCICCHRFSPLFACVCCEILSVFRRIPHAAENPAHGSWVERNGIGESRPLWVSMLGDFEVHICGSMSMLVCWPLEFFGRCTSMLVSKSLCRKHKSKTTMSYNVHVNHFMLRIGTWLTHNRLTWTSSWDVRKSMCGVHVNAKLPRKNANIDMERDFHCAH